MSTTTFDVADRPANNVARTRFIERDYYHQLLDQLMALPVGKCVQVPISEIPASPRTERSAEAPVTYNDHWNRLYHSLHTRLRGKKSWRPGMICHSWDDKFETVSVWLNQEV